MFNNAGSKVKSYATAVFVLDCIACLIIAIYAIVNDAALVGIISALVLLASSYITCLMLAAFGEISETLNLIYQKMPEAEKAAPQINQAISAFRNAPTPASAAPMKKQSAPGKVSFDSNRGKLLDGKAYIPTGFETIICPWCETEQPSGGEKCTSCGEKFHYNDK